MSFSLTSPFFQDYAFHTSANSEAGIGVPEDWRTTATRAVFLRPLNMNMPFMGGSCGEPSGSPVQSRYANLHVARPPDWRRGAEILNRFDWSMNMSKSKGALALVSPIPLDQLSPIINELYEVSNLAEFLCTSVMWARDTQEGEFSLSFGECAALISLMQSVADRIVNATTNLEEFRFDSGKEAASHE